MKVIEYYLGKAQAGAEGPQPRRTGIGPPLPGQRAREVAAREDSTTPSPDRSVALTGARLPGERPLLGDLPADPAAAAAAAAKAGLKPGAKPGKPAQKPGARKESP